MKSLLAPLTGLFKTTFSKNIAWTFMSQTIVACGGLLLNVLIGNKFGTSGLGVFSQAFTVYILLTLLADLGIANSTLKHIAEYSETAEERNKIFSSALLLAFIISATLTAVLLFLIHGFDIVLYNEKATLCITFLLPGLPFFILNRVTLSYLNALQKMRLFSIIHSIRWVMLISMISGFILFNFSLSKVLLAFLIVEASIFIWVVLYLIFKQKLPLSIDIPWVKEHLKFGTRVSLISLLSEGNNQTDILISSFFLNESQLGIYSLASSVAKGLLMIPQVIAMNFNPIIANLWAKRDLENLQMQIKTIKKKLAFISLPLILAVCLAYPVFAKFIMTDERFLQSVPLFYLITVGVALCSMFIFNGSFLTMAGFPNWQLVHVVVVLVFNVLTTSVCVYFFGLTGAALATSLLYIFVVFSLYFFIKLKTGLKII